jgi:SWI/SNF related-matrix-associated actin-dependent regulator of chromatin subfamily C
VPRAEAPAGAQAATPPPPPPAAGWSLPLAWLVASAAAAELLPESDWELAEAPPAGGKRPRDAPPLAEEAAKRARASAALPGVLPRRAPEAALGDSVIASASAGDGALQAPLGARIENLSAGQRLHVGVQPPRGPPAGPLPPPRADAGGCAVELPAFASWFKADSISEIERRGVPEFFTAAPNETTFSKTPDSYRRARNAIVARHRQLGGQRVTLSDCRDALPAVDAGALQRLFAFLEHWGIINHVSTRGGAAAHARPPSAAAAAAAALAIAPAAPEALRVLSDAGGPRPCHALFDFDPVRSGVAPGSVAPLLGAPPNGAAAAARCAALGGAPAVACNACGCDLSAVPRHHCTRLPDYDLCATHYAAGHFVGGVSSADFVRFDPGASAARPGPPPVAGRWSPQETLLLLEALELRGEDWAAVAAHVGTKSAQQCVAQFLALPIEDRFLDAAEGRPPAPLLGAAGPPPERLPGDAPALLPFADASNPLLSHAAFLAACAGPRVAAAAAHAALAALEAESNDQPQEGAEVADAQGVQQPRVSADAQRRGAAASLSAAAVKAKLLADQEERDAQRLVVGLVDSQLRKVDLKVRILDELDAVLLDASRDVDSRRVALAEDKATMAAFSLLSQRQKTQAQTQ